MPTIGNDCHGASSSSRSRQLGVQPPRSFRRPDPDGLERGVSHSERDEMVVVLVNQRLERRDLGRATDASVGEAVARCVRDGLDRFEDGVDEVGFLVRRE